MGESSIPYLEWCDIPSGKVIISVQQRKFVRVGDSLVDKIVDEKGPFTFDVKGFRIGKYPITYEQFQSFINAPDGFVSDQWWEGLSERQEQPGAQKRPIDNYPREMVSWFDAIAFCRWLSSKMGINILLPTEQQWQRAAQGDDGRLYPWGNKYDKSRCNVGNHQTKPVDAYPGGASPYGVMDMSGNVLEWCLNEFINPMNIDISVKVESRVLRGGHYFSSIERYLQTTERGSARPSARQDNFGFRCATVESS